MKTSSLRRTLSIATMVGLLGAVGNMGAQMVMRERPGHGQNVNRRNVSRETNSRPWIGDKRLNKCERKTGKYGGKDREEKMFKAELKRDRKRLKRIEWVGGMCALDKLLYIPGIGGFLDVGTCHGIHRKIGDVFLL